MLPIELEQINFKYPMIHNVSKNFITWKYEHNVFHMSKNFKTSSYKIVVTSCHIEKVPLKSRLYLKGMRQHLWRRFRKAKGFVPLLCLNSKTGDLIFAVKALSISIGCLESRFQAFISSNQHKSLLIYTSGAGKV